MIKAKADKLKQLKTRSEELAIELEIVKKRLSEAGKEYQEKLNRKKSVDAAIESLEQEDVVTISDHAILRYLERVEGIDIETIREKLLTSSAIDIYHKLDNNNGTYPSGDGYSLVIRNNNIITVTN